MDSLLTKYRPKTLKDVLGQPDVVRALALYAQAPYSAAMLFHGESGVGKTSAAYALARDLGCDVDEGPLGGFHEIPSGEMDAAAVRDHLGRLTLGTLFGSGWRVLVANEADRMSKPAETIWLDGLEHLPARSTVVFTTNQPERLSPRFRDRCEVYAFESDPDRLQPALQALARRVWKAEGLKGKPPGLDCLGMPTLGSLETMHASFRLALQQVGRLVREARAGGSLAKVKKQLKKDLLVTAQELAVECPECGQENDVPRGGRDRMTCGGCGKAFEIEL